MPSCRPLRCQPRRRAAPARASSSFFSAPTSSDTQIVPALLPRTIAIPNPHLRLSPLPPPDEGDGCCKEQVKEEQVFGPPKIPGYKSTSPSKSSNAHFAMQRNCQRVAEALSRKLSSTLCCLCEGGSSLSLFLSTLGGSSKDKRLRMQYRHQPTNNGNPDMVMVGVFLDGPINYAHLMSSEAFGAPN